MNEPPILELIGFRIVSMPYTRIRAIMSELGESEPLLRKAICSHGINPDDIKADTDIFFTISEEQVEFLKGKGVTNPTWFQVIGCSEVFSLHRDDCEERYRALKGDE